MIDLTIHCVVKNEEKWAWYAISSVKDIAKQIIVFDTGSTDKTTDVIKTIKSKKIHFERKGEVTPNGLTKLREEQLKITKTKWILLVDGDEIWPQVTLSELKSAIEEAPKDLFGAVVKAWNLVGDVYHYHSESTKYHWPFAPKNYSGWANLRLIRTDIPGLHLKGSYPHEAYCDKTDTPVQNYGSKKLVFLNNRYFHTTYLIRSSSREADRKVLNRAKKGKLEHGKKFPKGFRYPEVFYRERPSIVASPWQKRSSLEKSLSQVISPLKELRRNILGLYKPRLK